MMKLVIATPSPFARKARIALIEKQLPHESWCRTPGEIRGQGRDPDPFP
jgi:hypothetical protein